MLTRIFILSMLLIFSALSAYAQAQKVSLLSGGYPSVSGELPGTAVSTQSPAEQPLFANLNFGAISPLGFGTGRVIIRTPVLITTKAKYVVEAQRMGNPSDGVKASDIGFGICNVRLQNPASKDNAAGATNVAFAGSFGADPRSAPIQNGAPLFQATLASVGESPTILFSGEQTAKGTGNLQNNDGGILVDFVFVVAAQYYNANTASNLKLVLTIKQIG